MSSFRPLYPLFTEDQITERAVELAVVASEIDMSMSSDRLRSEAVRSLALEAAATSSTTLRAAERCVREWNAPGAAHRYD
jgi:hypothetical protein